jgi:hypothetical protein
VTLASLAGSAAALLATLGCAGPATAAPVAPEAPTAAAAAAFQAGPTTRMTRPAPGLTARQIQALTTVYAGPLNPQWVVLSRRSRPALAPAPTPAQEPADKGLQLTAGVQPAR